MGGAKAKTLPLFSEEGDGDGADALISTTVGHMAVIFGPYFLLPKANRQDQPLPGCRPEVKPPPPVK